MLPPLYLLDTNVLIRYVRRDAVGQRIEAHYHLLSTPTMPLISFVTEAELRSFALYRRWGAATLNQMEFVLTALRRTPVETPGALEAYVAIDVYSLDNGVTMGKNDVWIAATAVVTGATLLTTDHDFDHLDGIFLTREWIDPQNL